MSKRYKAELEFFMKYTLALNSIVLSQPPVSLRGVLIQILPALHKLWTRISMPVKIIAVTSKKSSMLYS